MARDILEFAEQYTIDTDDVELILGESMRSHTSFRIGGYADIFATPLNEEALAIGLEHCRAQEFPWFILGKGTNLLVSDLGYHGVIFDMSAMNAITVEGNVIRAEAGATLAALAHAALEHGLTGLEFASGIPGSLGGAVFMNAGAYGGEMKQVLRRVRLMNAYGGVREVPAAELLLGYRSSILQHSGEILLSAELELAPGEPAEIEKTMRELNEKRREKQPLEYPSAGSTFKRPEGYFAGKLIEDAGLKGFSVGDAQVSEKHCGFVVNKGRASARDVVRLCREVSARVKEQTGVELEMEVRLLGDF